MFGKRFQNDLKMIDAALESEEGEKELRRHLAAFVDAAVDEFMAENRVGASERDALAAAAWTHFRLAMERYRGRAELMLDGKNDVYYFSSYFAWFLRQGMTEHLNRDKQNG